MRGHEQRPRPADETGSCEWLRKRGAASGRNSRAGAGAAVQICKRTACATLIWVTATRSSAPIFTSTTLGAQKKLAKHKRTAVQMFKRTVSGAEHLANGNPEQRCETEHKEKAPSSGRKGGWGSFCHVQARIFRGLFSVQMVPFSRRVKARVPLADTRAGSRAKKSLSWRLLGSAAVSKPTTQTQ